MSEIVREAAWLTTEETELLIARHEGTVVSKEFFRRGKPQTATIFVAAGVLALAFKVASLNPAYLPFAIAAVGGMSLGLIPIVLHWEARQAAAHKVDDELREGFGRGVARFVSLIIRQGGAPTGEDRGLLWFEDGKMYFSGHRTSFGLVPSQVSGFATVDSSVPRVRHEVNLVLKRDTPAGPMSLSFGGIVPVEFNVAAQHASLRMDLDDWKQRGYGEEGQWPPSGFGPLVVSDRRLLFELAAWICLFPVMPTALALTLVHPGIALGTCWLVAFSMPNALGNDLRSRALRDRKKLRRMR